MMYKQKSTETVTLTRNQLQAILEIITQIGGINRSESWNESKFNKNDESIEFKDLSNRALEESSHWSQRDEDVVPSWPNGWLNDTNRSGSSSSLLMLNESQPSNQLMSVSSSDSSKGEELRADSVMTTVSSNEANFRRYSRINDSEFDWKAHHLKRAKAEEYRKALEVQYEDKMKRKREEVNRSKEEEDRLDKRCEEQRCKLKADFDRERKAMEEKKLAAEKKREAVIAAIEKTQKTPVIKRRSFLTDEPDEQPVATIKPLTRVQSADVSAQTEGQGVQQSDAGTQTDIQLLMQLFDKMNIISKEKSKSLSKLEESDKNKIISNKSVTPVIRRKSSYKVDNNLNKKAIRRSSVWRNKESPGVEDNPNEKKNQTEDYPKVNGIGLKSEKKDIETNERYSAFRRSALNLSQSTDNLSNLKNQRIKSSVDFKNRVKFLPEIGGRPHSRKKWYSQERFNPNFLHD